MGIHYIIVEAPTKILTRPHFIAGFVVLRHLPDQQSTQKAISSSFRAGKSKTRTTKKNNSILCNRNAFCISSDSGYELIMRSEQKRTSFSWCDNIAGNEQPKKKRARFRFHFILKYSLINQTEDEYKMRNNYTREHRMQERAYRWKFIVAMRIAWPTTQSITRKKKSSCSQFIAVNHLIKMFSISNVDRKWNRKMKFCCFVDRLVSHIKCEYCEYIMLRAIFTSINDPWMRENETNNNYNNKNSKKNVKWNETKLNINYDEAKQDNMKETWDLLSWNFIFALKEANSI